jgi:ubiquitin C-terminal hydrolase
MIFFTQTNHLDAVEWLYPGGQLDSNVTIYWMTEHQRMCRTCNAVSTNMEGRYSFLLQFTSNHFNEQKDCTLKELFQVYQEGSVLEEYKHKKCSVQSEAVETDKIVTLPSFLCVVVSRNINHEGRPILIDSPVDYPVNKLHGANITLDKHMNNDGHSYRFLDFINSKSACSDTGHYTAICKSKDSRDWFEYNNGDVWKSKFRKHNGGPKKAHQRLVRILFHEETGILDSNHMLSKQA